jgi:hypothetical protein
LKFLADVNISEEDSIHSFGEHFMKSANLLKRISIEPTVMLGKPVSYTISERSKMWFSTALQRVKI